MTIEATSQAPVLSERCCCNALFEVGEHVLFSTALSAAQEWRRTHRCSGPPPADTHPLTESVAAAVLEQATEPGQPVLGFRADGGH